MPNPFPEIEPYDDGMLEVGDGNAVYWKTYGNPDGKPAVILHGGPGAGSPKGTHRSFDPTKYRIVSFDQRGCGRSTPHASDPATDMSVNTTPHLLRDIELLREHLGIDRWLVFGGSWGSTLALAYAQQFPERVTEIVLVAVTTSTRAENDWLYRGVGRFFPGEWQAFKALVPDDDDIIGAYARLMEDPDPEVRSKAAEVWLMWEDAVLSLETSGRPSPFADKPTDAGLAFVRICAHYWSHGSWLEEGQLLRDIGKLAGIPGVLVHGLQDLSCPVEAAWQLSQAWPGAELHTFADAGHKGSPAFGARIGETLARFAERR
jgi:proline iminopeptidase